MQKIQLASATKKEVVADRELIHRFAEQYLDSPVMVSLFFLKPAVPFLKNTRPYQQIPIAAMSGNTDDVLGKTSFFIQEKNPVKSFEVYFRNLLLTNSNIIVYNKKEVMGYLAETTDSDLVKTADGKLVGFRDLFEKGMLFHYLLRGDYSPENVALIFLKEKNQGLNSALLGMGWQRKLFERSRDFSELMSETTLFLEKMLKFQFDFARYLKDKF